MFDVAGVVIRHPTIQGLITAHLLLKHVLLLFLQLNCCLRFELQLLFLPQQLVDLRLLRGQVPLEQLPIVVVVVRSR